MSAPWTKEQTAKLKELNAQGLSASRIAVLLGGEVTRNAVIGKLDRLKEPMRSAETKRKNDPSAGDVWSAEETEALKAYKAKGLSFGQTARLLGKSRNACQGKAHRLGLTSDVSVGRQTGALQAKLTRAAHATERNDKVVPLRREPELAPFSGPTKLLIDLQPGECRWPIDDPGPGRMDQTQFCGRPGAPLLGLGRPYCPDCSAGRYRQLITKAAEAIPQREALQCAS